MMLRQHSSPYFQQSYIFMKSKESTGHDGYPENSYFLKPRKREFQRQLLDIKYSEQHLFPTQNKIIVHKQESFPAKDQIKSRPKLISTSSLKSSFESLRKRMLQRKRSSRMSSCKPSQSQQSISLFKQSKNIEDSSKDYQTKKHVDGNRCLRGSSNEHQFHLLIKLQQENIEAKTACQSIQMEIHQIQRKIEQQRKEYNIQKSLHAHHVKSLKNKIRLQDTYPANKIKTLLLARNNYVESFSEAEMKEQNTARSTQRDSEDDLQLKIDSLKDDLVIVRG